jgi:hypothetical protein
MLNPSKIGVTVGIHAVNCGLTLWAHLLAKVVAPTPDLVSCLISFGNLAKSGLAKPHAPS